MKDIFLRFLEERNADSTNIVLNTLSFLKEDNWSIFTAEEIDRIIMIIHESKNVPQLKQTCIKFFGYIIYHKRFYENEELIKEIIDRLCSYQNETNHQICLKNSWAIANICGNCDLNVIGTSYLTKLFAISLKYAYSSKEKIVSSAIRALGFLLSRTSETSLRDTLSQLNTDQNQFVSTICEKDDQDNPIVTVDLVVKLLLEKLNNS